MNQEGDLAQRQAERHVNWTGSHQSAKRHRAKINGKVLTKEYLLQECLLSQCLSH